jgi:hypothetical protein
MVHAGTVHFLNVPEWDGDPFVVDDSASTSRPAELFVLEKANRTERCALQRIPSAWSSAQSVASCSRGKCAAERMNVRHVRAVEGTSDRVGHSPRR